MFMAYQPHLYERDQRRQRLQHQHDMSRNSSLADRRHSASSAPQEYADVASIDSVKRDLPGTIPEDSSTDAKIVSNGNGNGLLGKLSFSRNRSVRSSRRPRTADPRLGQSTEVRSLEGSLERPVLARVESRDTQELQSSLSKYRYGQESSSSSPSSSSQTSPGLSPDSSNSTTPSASPKSPRNLEIAKDDTTPAKALPPSPQSPRGTRPPPSRAHMPPSSRRGRPSRPATANEASNSKAAQNGGFARMAASRSVEDLTEVGDGLPKTHDDHFFDDKDNQEILTLGQKANEKPRGRGALSQDSEHASYYVEEDEAADLTTYPLPVRMGLVSYRSLETQSKEAASASPEETKAAETALHTSMTTCRRKYSARYVDGFYLVTPPPRPAKRGSSLTSKRLGSPSAARHRISNASSMSSMWSRQNSEAYAGLPVAMPRSDDDLSRKGSVRSSVSSFHGGQWKLHEYFDVKCDRRHGHFGVKERRLHAYTTEEAPYPFGYGLDSLTAESLLHTATKESATEIDAFDAPKRVLDIGCGAGSWILDRAKCWTSSEFVGLDLVPVQQPIGKNETDLRQRVSWVVANVLNGLPFPEASFDLVHIRFLNAGIPERKWPLLLAEVSRVLAPNGRLEIIESDMKILGSQYLLQTKELLDVVVNAGSPHSKLSADPAYTAQHKSSAQRNLALMALLSELLQRRGINGSPTKFLPAYLAKLDKTVQIEQSDVKYIPLVAQSLQKILTQLTVITHASKMVEFEKRMTSLDSIRTAILMSDALLYSDCRHALWQEAESLQKTYKRMSMAPSQSTQASGKANSISGASATPLKSHLDAWKDFAVFERELDGWERDMREHANFEGQMRQSQMGMWAVEAMRFKFAANFQTDTLETDQEPSHREGKSRPLSMASTTIEEAYQGIGTLTAIMSLEDANDSLSTLRGSTGGSSGRRASSVYHVDAQTTLLLGFRNTATHSLVKRDLL